MSDHSFEQSAFESAKNYISQLGNRPDLLKALIQEIGQTAAPDALPQRVQVRKAR